MKKNLQKNSPKLGEDPLPRKMRKKAIQFARTTSGIERPCKENAPLVKAWEDGFLSAKELILNSLGEKQ